MQDYQLRVHNERAELHEKIHKLILFIESDKFFSISSYEKVRMQRQLEIMFAYSDILTQRILAFKDEDVKT